jgi:hypothetical protein
MHFRAEGPQPLGLSALIAVKTKFPGRCPGLSDDAPSALSEFSRGLAGEWTDQPLAGARSYRINIGRVFI